VILQPEFRRLSTPGREKPGNQRDKAEDGGDVKRSHVTREVIDEHGRDVEQSHADHISVSKEFMTARALGNQENAKAKDKRKR
jgi:hypothetical protein